MKRNKVVLKFACYITSVMLLFSYLPILAFSGNVAKAESLSRESFNLIKNGDFENGSNGWDILKGRFPEIFFDTESQSKVAKFDNYVDGENRSVIQQGFEVEANTDYVISFSFRKFNPKSQVDAFIELLKSDGTTRIKGWWLNYRENDMWYSTRNVVNSGNNTKLFLKIADQMGGNAYIDNITFGKKLNIKVESEGDGTVKGPAMTDIAAGDNITVTAIPKTGKKFEGWYDTTGALVSTEAEYCFVAKDDQSLIARFESSDMNANLIFNGDFENGTNDWEIYVGSYPELVYDNESGSNVALFNKNYGGNNRSVIQQTVSVNKNTDYIVSFDFRRFNSLESGKTDLYIAVLSENATTVIKDWFLNYRENDKWYPQTNVINSGNNTELVFRLADQPNGGHAFIDNIRINRKLDIQVKADGCGVVKGPEQTNIIKGNDVKVVATPEEGYSFLGWYDTTGALVSTEAEYCFVAKDDQSLIARFESSDMNANLIFNGDFENGTNDWEIYVGSYPELVYDNESGSNVALFNKNYGGNNRSVIQQTVSVNKNTDYIVSFDFRRFNSLESGKTDLYIAVLSENATTVIKDWFLNYRENDKWYPQTNVINSGNNTELVFRLADQPNGGHAFIDNIRINRKLDIQVKADGCGVVKGPEQTNIIKGNDVKVVATPLEGYSFLGWYAPNGEIRSFDTEYEFQAESDILLTAKFVKISENINLIKNGNFEKGTDNWNVWAGSMPEIVCDVQSNSHAAHFNQYVSENNRNAIVQSFDVEPNTEYVVSFTYKKGNPINTIDAELSVLTNDNTVLKNWALNDREKDNWYFTTQLFDSGDNTRLKFRVMDQNGGNAFVDNISIYKKINIQVHAEGNGTVENHNKAGVIAGDIVSVTAYPDDGYELLGWYNSEGKLLSQKSRYEFIAENNISLIAKFEIEKTRYNLIKNGGFEDDLNKWGTFIGTQPETVFDSETQSEVVQLNKYVDSVNRNSLVQTVEVEKNTDYVISFSFKKFNGKDVVDAYLSILSNNDAVIKEWFINYTDKDKWYTTTNVFNTGESSIIKLRIADQPGGNVYIDNICIAKKCTINSSAGKNGKLSATVPSYAGMGSNVIFSAIPDVGYMVEGWYINGNKVSSENEFEYFITEDIEIEVKFTDSVFPFMSEFETSRLYCNEKDNFITDGGFENGNGVWNKPTFIKSGTTEIVTQNGSKVLHFSSNSSNRQVVSFKMKLKGNTKYVFATDVKGSFYSQKNHFDMSFGIMNLDGSYINLDYPRGAGYYDETPNMSDEKSMTPPSWDNQWHRRGIIIETRNECEVLIAISGKVSDAYFDNMMLCEYDKAFKENKEHSSASLKSNSPTLLGCLEKDNLVENFSFSSGEKGWTDGFGWKGMFSGLTVFDSGNQNKSLYMSSTTGKADKHYYIKWIKVKPNTDYTLSVATASSSDEADFGLLVQSGGMYKKLINWTVGNDCTWMYSGASFNSGNCDQIGFYVKEAGKTTVVDELRLFETSKARILTDKLTGTVELFDKTVEEPNVEDAEITDEDNETENTQTVIKKIIRKKLKMKNNNSSDDTFNWVIVVSVACAVLVLISGAVVTVVFLKKRKGRKNKE